MRVLTNTKAATTATTTTTTPTMIVVGNDRGAGLAVEAVDVGSDVCEALLVGVRVIVGVRVTVGVELEDRDAVEFANGVANGTMSFKSIGVWTDGVHCEGTFGLALAVLPT